MEDQLKRLLTQLQDIEDMKDDMDEDEYDSTRKVFLSLFVLSII